MVIYKNHFSSRFRHDDVTSGTKTKTFDKLMISSDFLSQKF